MNPISLTIMQCPIHGVWGVGIDSPGVTEERLTYINSERWEECCTELKVWKRFPFDALGFAALVAKLKIREEKEVRLEKERRTHFGGQQPPGDT